MATKIPPVALSIETSQEVYRALGDLAKTGMFGTTRTDVAEQLLREKIREVERQGWTGRWPRK